MGEEKISFYLDILNRRKKLNDINSTSIVLIPKVNKPSNMTQFKPISLCNVVYKIISKVVYWTFAWTKQNNFCSKETDQG
ncbi:reverse transcriptase [Gossypium australe]|uniref:Reverse transcriptase n=1 Tax=Gossypium australe TaxID=47621 RepID=A0A5B6WG65_9ROSI|nr:reverse transcriptase [Gossypium australe]